ncbi:GtrA family protein [Fibrobacter sp.]|uniref:GtrA family protein n=1 Tax=Fibrobacter sp. TaxID=35828 RepID=UPI0025BD6042|nr:GtrA family protein [Fibrobacter sp.]MCI6438176.1 GtrA family protein [Fibrobacter sp.]
MFADKIKAIRGRFPRKSLLGQFLRYLVTGGLAFVVDFGLFALCLYVFDWHYLLANLVGLVAGLVLNYTMSIVWVFTACERALEKRKVMEFSLFALVGIAGVGINQLLMFLMVGVFDWNEMVSKMVAAVLVLMWNFGARKLMLFRERKE